VVILGLGNVLAGDDGVGSLAARSLEENFQLPAGIRVLEVGTLGPNALAWLQPEQRWVVLDAVRGGGEPGTLYRMDLKEIEGPRPVPLSVHDLGLDELLREARLMGWPVRGVLLGVEPGRLEAATTELSPPVAAVVHQLQSEALREAVRLLEE
jgi:hydrogenase maturation protease